MNTKPRSGTLEDLDDLLSELEVMDGGRKPPSIMRDSKKQSKNFDDLEKLVAQFEDEKPLPTIKPPQKPSNPPENEDEIKTEIGRKQRRTTLSNKPPPEITTTENVCPGCNEFIEGTHIEALGKRWHTDHFVCSRCNTEIRGDFYDLNGKPVCKNCMATQFPCSHCGEPIVREYLMGDGKFFHPECVDRHYCAGCSKQIEATTKKISALDRHYHSECFICTGCQSRLETTFYAKDDQPYCTNCSQTAAPVVDCSNCGKAISGGSLFVEYLGKKYHDNCFGCSRCSTSLDPSAFYDINGEPFCKDCASQVQIS